MVAHRAEPGLPRGRVVRRARATRSRGCKGDRYLRRDEESPTRARRPARRARSIWRWVTPRWQRHLERILERERRRRRGRRLHRPDGHLRGIPTALRERFGVPVVFYDGDVPMSLPEFGGMDTGFNYYHGADPGEYDLVVSNSEGGLERLRELGARRAEARLLGRRPRVLRAACRSRRSTTSSSTATATSSGASGCASSSASRRGACPTSTSRSAATTSRATSAARAQLGDVPFNALRRAISSARVNLNITRRSHATVLRVVDLPSVRARRWRAPRSSRTRTTGIERWFEPGRELLVVERRRRGDRGLPRAARRSGAAEELGRRARASACSTSTRTRIARGGCST